MQTTLATLIVTTLVAGTQPALAAGDPVAGKAKAGACVACHGLAGISNNGIWPNLAGQKPAYFVKQLKGFRDATRKDPAMEGMAKGLSDEDIENLAAYYSQLTGK